MVTKYISSLQHPLVKHLVKLQRDSIYRREQRRVVVVGKHVLVELAPTICFRRILLVDEAWADFSMEWEEKIFLPATAFHKITGLITSEYIAAEIDLPIFVDLSHASLVLLLDGISDPGNLGTLIRTAHALCWDGVFLLPGCADPYNSKAVRASQGAVFRLALAEGSWGELQTMRKKRDFHLYAADPKGESLGPASVYRSPLILALGNEAHGLSPSLRTEGHILSIPMRKDVESLNVAVAGGILMYHIANKVCIGID